MNRSPRPSPVMLAGLFAGCTFSCAWIMEGNARPGYNPWRHAISSLSLGKNGWEQVAAFIVTGLLLLVFAFDARRRLQALTLPTRTAWTLTVVAVGFLGAGAFLTGPINGYPPGELPTFSLHDTLHRAFSALVFIGFPLAMTLFARSIRSRAPGIALASRMSTIAFSLLCVMAGLGFKGVTFDVASAVEVRTNDMHFTVGPFIGELCGTGFAGSATTEVATKPRMPCPAGNWISVRFATADFGHTAGAMQRIAITIAFAWVVWLTYLLWASHALGTWDADEKD